MSQMRVEDLIGQLFVLTFLETTPVRNPKSHKLVRDYRVEASSCFPKTKFRQHSECPSADHKVDQPICKVWLLARMSISSVFIAAEYAGDGFPNDISDRVDSIASEMALGATWQPERHPSRNIARRELSLLAST